MERITPGRSEVIAEALDCLPPPLRSRVSIARFWTADPIWSGLHSNIETDDGRTYRETAHVCYPYHTADKSIIVVLPEQHYECWQVIHELGHVAHFTLGLEDFGTAPVTEYATRNYREAFAEAFTMRFFYTYGDEQVAAEDWPTRLMLDQIEAVPETWNT